MQSLWHDSEQAALNVVSPEAISHTQEPPAAQPAAMPEVPAELPAWSLARAQANRSARAQTEPEFVVPEWRGLAWSLNHDLIDVCGIFLEQSSPIADRSARLASSALPQTTTPTVQTAPLRPRAKVEVPADASALPWKGLSTALDMWNVSPSPPARRRRSPPLAPSTEPLAEPPPTATLVQVQVSTPAEKKLPSKQMPQLLVPFALSSTLAQDLNAAPSPSPPKRRKRNVVAKGLDKENDRGEVENQDEQGDTPTADATFDGFFTLSPLSTLSIVL